ncbi:MAG: response regulator [Bacteroidetes bacterium]|nr:response regulator [Bacteroidota bacterium]
MAHILVIDDSMVDRQIIANALIAAGHTVTEAADGEDGEKKAVNLQPNLIVLDVIMPRKNGFEVCRTLKNTPETAAIPVVMLTSKNQDSDKFWGMKQGAVEYITKPFSDEALQNVIKKYV